MSDVGEGLAAFVAMPETRQTVQPKNLISRTEILKGPNQRQIANRKIGLPLNSLCNCENNDHLADTIIFRCASIPPPFYTV